jgi:hypothetical protein
MIGGMQGGRITPGAAADYEQLRFANVGHELLLNASGRLTPAARLKELYMQLFGIGHVPGDALDEHDQAPDGKAGTKNCRSNSGATLAVDGHHYQPNSER